MPTYVVKPGDTLSAIAKAHGLSSWQALYNDPANAVFRTKRPNPNLIFPGDQIVVPGGTPVTPLKMAIIDGTGDSEDSAYQTSMANSFCRQLADQLDKNARYWRGPSWHGVEVKKTATAAHQWLKQHYDEAQQSVGGVRLMLAGYSRGASAAIMVAEQLEKQSIPVDSLFLFDAVARHHYKGGEVIPANVAFSRHARRDLNAILLVLKYEGTFADAKALPNASNPMRPSFGNTGLTWRGDGDHESAEFIGSHGALGGVGWSFVTEDPHCQDQVADWMNDQLKSRGAKAVLKSMQIPSGPAPTSPSSKLILANWALDLLLIARHNQNLKKGGKVP